MDAMAISPSSSSSDPYHSVSLWINRCTISDLLIRTKTARTRNQVIAVNSNDTLEKALQVMNDHDILSVAVRDADNTGVSGDVKHDLHQHLLGMVSVMDCLHPVIYHSVFRSYEDKEISDYQSVVEDQKKYFSPTNVDYIRESVLNQSVLYVCGLCENTPTIKAFAAPDSLMQLIQFFARGYHRGVIHSWKKEDRMEEQNKPLIPGIRMKEESMHKDEGSSILSDSDQEAEHAIYNKLWQWTTIASQSDLIRLLFSDRNNPILQPFLSQSLDKIVSIFDPISFIPSDNTSRKSSYHHPINYALSNHSALSAFRCLHHADSKHRAHLAAVPIIDPSTNRLVGSLSASDFRNITADSLHELLLPVLDFLKQRQKARQSSIFLAALTVKNTLSASDELFLKNVQKEGEDVIDNRPPIEKEISQLPSLNDAIQLMVEEKVHRVWLIDRSRRVCGVVSMTDISKSLLEYAEKNASKTEIAHNEQH